jgi:hypothetical protein
MVRGRKVIVLTMQDLQASSPVQRNTAGTELIAPIRDLLPINNDVVGYKTEIEWTVTLICGWRDEDEGALHTTGEASEGRGNGPV